MRVTIGELQEKKKHGEKISMLTAYDFGTAKLIDGQGIDIILVGDSLAMVFLGHNSTLTAEMDDMLYHTRAVAKGTERALIVGDMPFLSYQVNSDEALRNAGLFLKNGAQAVKLEGAGPIVSLVKRLTSVGIPVMGHLGLTPQSVNQLSGYKVQAKDEDEIKKLITDADALQEAGIFALVLECVPTEVACIIAGNLKIPVIGIGAGVKVDGQVLVINDLLGLSVAKPPKFVKQYAHLSSVIQHAVQRYRSDVETGKFPTERQGYVMDAKVVKKIQKLAKKPAAKAKIGFK